VTPQQLSGLACLLCLVVFAAFCLSGLDLTDEGFYLNWIKNPWEYSYSLSAFGFFFHVLALLFPDNVAAWRWCGGLLLIVSSAVFYFYLCRYAGRQLLLKESVSFPTVLFLSVTALSFYSWWLPTPNYNLLNFAGCLVFFGGLLCSATPPREHARNARIIAPVAIGLLSIGAVAIWLARPTTLIPMSFIAALFSVAHRRLRVFLQCVLAAVVFFIALLVIALVIDGSVGAFVKRYELGLSIISLLRPPFIQSTWDQFSNPISLKDWLDFLGLAVAFFLIFLAGSPSRRVPRQFMRLAIVVSVLAIVMYVGRGIAAYNGPSPARLMPLAAVLALAAIGVFRQRSVARSALSIFVVIVCLWLAYFGAPALLLLLILVSILLTGCISRGFKEVGGPSLQVALLMCWAPLAFGFGSGNSMELMAGLASTFWVAATFLLTIIFLPEIHRRVEGWTSVGFTFATLASLVGGAANPYRLIHPLWEQKECIGLGRSALPICLDHASAVYFQKMKDGAVASGFRENTPVIDLTGSGPTTIFFLGGMPVGAPWILAGYPGSEEFARKSLETVAPSILKRAWVLKDETGNQRIPDAVMKSLGLTFPFDYSEVVRVGVKTVFDAKTHLLLKPRPFFSERPVLRSQDVWKSVSHSVAEFKYPLLEKATKGLTEQAKDATK
jgi:hypothetical protein